MEAREIILDNFRPSSFGAEVAPGTAAGRTAAGGRFAVGASRWPVSVGTFAGAAAAFGPSASRS